jgi:hypothetical protein
MMTFMPGMRARSFLSLRPLPHFQPDVDLGRVHVLRVLVELSPPRAASRGNHLRVPEQRLLDETAQPVGLLERRSGQGHRGEREGPLVEVRKEGTPCDGEPDSGKGNKHE